MIEMWCPKCASETTNVLKTVKGSVNERFRKCATCRHTFTTIEIIKSDADWTTITLNAVGEYAKEDEKKEVATKLIQGTLF